MKDKDYLDWAAQGLRNGWEMPKTSWWKTWPIIRHVRTLIAVVGASNWYEHGPGQFGIPTGEDDWILWGMWRGLERDKEELEL